MDNDPHQLRETWMLNQIQNNMLKPSFEIAQWTFREVKKVTYQ